MDKKWTVEARGDHWYIVCPGERAKNMGPVRMKGTNYYDKAVIEAHKRNGEQAPVILFDEGKRGVAGTITKMYVDNDKMEEMFGTRTPIGGVVEEFPKDGN